MFKKERIEIILKNPNPIFEKWLIKWQEEAESKGSKSQYKIRDALESLRRFPLPLMTGKDCAILRGFGPTLCSLIDKELQLLKESNSSKITTNTIYHNDIQEVVKSVQKEKIRKTTKTTKAKPSKAKQLQFEEEQQVIMSPGSFEIFLLVDVQETAGKMNKSNNQTREYLEHFQIPHEIRRLTVGDFIWICRDKQKNELVLPYIVERKRMDDLASSIRDGRFHEQKFRLKSSKIQNLMYLIEDHGNNEHVGLPIPSLLQAAINTQVQDGFQVKFTKNHWQSIMYLKVMTTTLTKYYKDKLLIGTAKKDLKQCQPTDRTVGLMKFKEFYDTSARNCGLTIKDVFVKQLLQLHSLSMERALAIVQDYPTPKLLLNAYDSCESEQEAKLLLAKIKYGQLQKSVGVAISSIMHDFYRTEFE